MLNIVEAGLVIGDGYVGIYYALLFCVYLKRSIIKSKIIINVLTGWMSPEISQLELSSSSLSLSLSMIYSFSWEHDLPFRKVAVEQ